ncbi:hypothetical protein FGD67_05795 [Colwellia sp. M166]|jgi:murein lipoprotein|uniref:Lpp/OprI family alanine-zipper lipoprotein n=1 Tax=Colwellia sp. M166 TaxID=2583805 RepID=UPI00211E1AD7|nr:Lpp/OprI family alanine-zipper lipoprotein [Colwellia sp. M166]UUO22747.1 hypothetical protein FGD67_05795 [Colwellia sp. M166]|tara:strand:- start:15198 stop:15458 length:261 start_codon:yes stop_codon:yes gene_type:complete
MLLKKITLITLVAIISGCANTSALEENISQLSQKVDRLTKQVDSLTSQTKSISTEVNDLSSAQAETKMAVEKANDRIDNMVASYKK